LTVSQVQLWLIFGLVVTSYLVLTHFGAKHLKAMLVVLLLYSFSVFVHRINLENASSIIVYNSNNNPLIHLIGGKENYVISEEKVLPAELQYSPFVATQKKLGLNKPVILLATDSIKTKDLYLHNRRILFKGKTIDFGKNSDKNRSVTKPDYLVNPDPFLLSKNQPDSAMVIVTNKKYFRKSTESNNQIYCTFNQGAFLKRW
jgi:hypothetical protein